MTEETAIQVSEMLIQSLKKHGFECIGSFALNEESSDREVSNDYEYTDSETGLNKLEQQSKIHGEARVGLERLIDVSLQYFTTARSLPAKFRQTFPLQASRQPEEVSQAPYLQFRSLNEETIDLDFDLNNNNDLIILIDLLLTIRQNINFGDEEFFNSLDRFN